ncbi:MAG: hypothetical protein ACREQC_17445, partial [Candidatus Binataceae bacterium]
MKDQQLQLSGATLAPQPNRQQGLAFNTLAPSGQYSYQQIFYGPNLGVDPSNKPKALDVTFDGARLATQNKPHFTSGRYNYHYDLTCVASGKAALAEGGSTQVDATQGCMNQWMSNGVWKMRVLKVMPFPEGAAAANQGGWSVVQEWVNVTHGKVFPGGLPDIGNRVAPTNVSDEFLATKGGNNASTFNTVGGFHLGARNVPFAPGEPYTFSQLIAWNPLDPADTPTRLLVTFDVTSQNAEKLSIPVPRYRNPANFRINLACGGKVVSAPGVNALQSPPPQPASAAAPQRMASAQMPSGGRTPNVDPCAMLSAPDVASALGVGVRSLGTAQRPSPDECAWPVAARAGAPAQNVVLVMQNVPPAKPHCHG